MWLQGLLKFAGDKWVDVFLGDSKIINLFALMELEKATGNDEHTGVIK
jgi:hypothetical protein